MQITYAVYVFVIVNTLNTGCVYSMYEELLRKQIIIELKNLIKKQKI